MPDLAELNLIIKSDEVEKATSRLEKFDKIGEKVGETTAELKNKFLELAAIAGLAFGLERTFETVVKFDSALAMLQIQTGLTAKATDELGNAFLRMGPTVGKTAAELATMAATAARMGVGAEQLEQFTEISAKFGEITGQSGVEAATGLASVLRVTGESADNIEKLANVFTMLGTSSKAGASEIENMTTALVRSAPEFNLTSRSAAALSATLLGGGAGGGPGGGQRSALVLAQALRTLKSAVDEGESKLGFLGQISGLGGQGFASLFSSNTEAGLQAFVAGLQQLKNEGVDVARVLKELGIGGGQVDRVLLSLAKNNEAFTKNLAASNEEWEHGTSVEEKFSIIEKTLEDHLKDLNAAWTNGQARLREYKGPLNDVLEGLTDAIRIMTGLKDRTEETSPIIILLKDAFEALAIALGAIAVLKTVSFLTNLSGATLAFAATVGAIEYARYFVSQNLEVELSLQRLVTNFQLAKRELDKWIEDSNVTVKAPPVPTFTAGTPLRDPLEELRMQRLGITPTSPRSTGSTPFTEDSYAKDIEKILAAEKLALDMIEKEHKARAGLSFGEFLFSDIDTAATAAGDKIAKFLDSVHDKYKQFKDKQDRFTIKMGGSLPGGSEPLVDRASLILGPAVPSLIHTKESSDGKFLNQAKYDEEFSRKTRDLLDDANQKQIDTFFDRKDVKEDLLQEKNRSGTDEAFRAYLEKQLKLQEDTQKLHDIAEGVGKAFESSFTDALTGAKSFSEAIQSLAKDVERLLVQQLIAAPLAQRLSGFVTGVGTTLGFGGGKALGAAYSGGIEMFGSGGIFGSPTLFSYAGGTGMLGEKGPEAIMPLARDGAGRLGVRGGGGTTNVTMIFPNANVDSFRRSEGQVKARLQGLGLSGARGG